jgi:hypothetical protein
MHEKWTVVLVENINIVQKKMDDIQMTFILWIE